ncbi:MAG: long-chain fatty acid--CoA ligase [Actinomycetia bacterium]|nr:long-chain fatty acid--CoA ligase [Actinomycetes bacterium]
MMVARCGGLAVVNFAAVIASNPVDATALISRGQTTTWGTLRHQAASLRGGLAELGVGPDHRVALVCANNWYFVVAYLAALGVGATVVPLNPQSPPAELAHEIEQVDARVVIAGPGGRRNLQQLAPEQLARFEAIVLCGEASIPGSVSLDDLLEFDPLDIVDRPDTAPAVLLFTSGTAGSKKAAILTHGNLKAAADIVLAAPGGLGRADDIAYGVLPLYHVFGLAVLLGATMASGSAVLLVERFDPDAALESIAQRRLTAVLGPPTMWAALAAQPDADPAAMESVRIAVSGAARLPVEVSHAVNERFGIELAEGYGLTETSSVASSASALGAPAGSIGRPLPGVEMRLVDADGDDVYVGDEGEILVKGPNVFAGYWEEPDATESVLTSDGWLHTGDVGVIDDDGWLYLVDRLKDLVIVSGFNVHPAEVEAVLREHPAVRAAAVVGVPHPHTGEAIRAYVVVGDGQAEENDIIAFVGERVARYKCPAKITFVDEIPTGLGGKILRRELR